MFVRWKRRPLRRRRPWSPPDEHALYAVLVESRRVDGRPRQRVVRYLGAIKEGQLRYPLSVDHFWQTVDRNLAFQQHLPAFSIEGQRRHAGEQLVRLVRDAE